jgi:hypothetical protein
VLCEGVQGPGVVKASGSVSERPLIKGCNDVEVDRFHQACRFLASLGFSFPLRGYSDEGCRTRTPASHFGYAEVKDGTCLAPPKGGR